MGVVHINVFMGEEGMCSIYRYPASNCDLIT